jgi:hypothetical protein
MKKKHIIIIILSFFFVILPLTFYIYISNSDSYTCDGDSDCASESIFDNLRDTFSSSDIGGLGLSGIGQGGGGQATSIGLGSIGLGSRGAKKSKRRQSTCSKSSSSCAKKPSASLPQFPWPAPKPSAISVIPNQLLFTNKQPTLGDIENKLYHTLQSPDCGYSEIKYYGIPNGFAMVTRIEQFNPKDGRSKTQDRWLANVQPPHNFSLKAWLQALFTANPGSFRIIVFLVTDQLKNTTHNLSKNQAMAWLSSGSFSLPTKLKNEPFTPQHLCTAFIYEFFQSHAEYAQTSFVELSSLPGLDHLKGAKIWQALNP